MVELWQEYGYAWVILPALIFLARILDVSIGTLRVIFLAKGAKIPASATGFFEALIWLIIISQVIQNLGNFMSFIGYAGGFAAGTYVGMKIEERMAIGNVVVRVITGQPADELVEAIRSERFGVTSVPAEGTTGPVRILFMVVNRSRIKKVIDLINRHNPKAFYSIEDVRHVREGIFSASQQSSVGNMTYAWRHMLKGK